MIISFINPPIKPFRKIMRNFDCATESKGNYLYQPYDFLLMSARVPKDWNLFLIDSVADDQSADSVMADLKRKKPQICVLAMADTNWDQDLEFLKNLRNDLPEARIYVCGDSFWESSSCLKVERFCDGIIDNAITVDFVELSGFKKFPYLNTNTKKPSQVTLGTPRHSIFTHPNYRWPFARYFAYTTIFTAWGCPYSCSYCIMRNFPNVWRPAADVIEEMRYVKQLGFREIYVGDKSFGLPRQNCIEILKCMIHENFRFSWSTYFRPDQYDPELLELMAKSGCHTIIVGVETTNYDTLRKYGRIQKNDVLEKLIMHARSLKMDVCGDFIIGLPGDSSLDIEQTIQFSQKLDLQYASFNIAAPLAGTEIRSQNPESYHFDSLGKNNVLSNRHLTGQQIRNYRNQAVREFYLRPNFLLKKVYGIKNWQHFLIQIQEGIQLLSKVVR